MFHALPAEKLAGREPVKQPDRFVLEAEQASTTTNNSSRLYTTPSRTLSRHFREGKLATESARQNGHCARSRSVISKSVPELQPMQGAGRVRHRRSMILKPAVLLRVGAHATRRWLLLSPKLCHWCGRYSLYPTIHPLKGVRSKGVMAAERFWAEEINGFGVL